MDGERQPPRLVYRVHDSPGRLRLRLIWLHDRPGEADPIADAIAEAPGVREVRVRPYTGSVLVLYDPARTDVDRLSDAVCRAAGVDRLTIPGEETAHELDEMIHHAHEQGSDLARAAAAFWKGMHFDVLRATGGRVSLGTLASFTMLGAAAFRVASQGRIDLPAWHQLLWWGLRSFTVAEADTLARAQPPHTPLATDED